MVATSKARAHPVWWEFVEESLEEGSYSWRRRERALGAPDHDLRDVSRFAEERLLGCIDGLRVTDEAVERLLAPALQSEDPCRVSVAAHALAEGSETAWECLMAALTNGPDENLAPLCRGIELVWPTDLLPRLQNYLPCGQPVLQAAVLEICAFRRRAPSIDLKPFITGGDPGVQRAALLTARFVPRAQAEPLIACGLALPPPAFEVAIESGLVLGLPAARSPCAQALRRLPKDCGRLLVLGALAGSREHEHRDLLKALGSEPLAPVATWALGFAGTRDAADACVDLLRQERLAQLAFEAFCAITGVDFKANRLTVPAPEENTESAVPFEQDDLDADLVPKVEAWLMSTSTRSATLSLSY